jgi:hypothetical protein
MHMLLSPAGALEHAAPAELLLQLDYLFMIRRDNPASMGSGSASEKELRARALIIDLWRHL